MAVIDPLGNLAQAVLGLVPSHRAHELVYLNPTDLERPIGFNVLEQVHPDKHAVVADDIVSAFVHIWGATAVADRSQQVLRNSIRALMEFPGTTLLAIPRLLTDDIYRARIVGRIRDPVVLAYWRNQFGAYDDAFRTLVIAPILNKLDAVLSAGALRNIIGQPKSTIDLRKIMDEGRILIVNMSKGTLGEGNAHLLGRLSGQQVRAGRLRACRHAGGRAPTLLPLRRRVPGLRQRRLHRASCRRRATMRWP